MFADTKGSRKKPLAASSDKGVGHIAMSESFGRVQRRLGKECSNIKYWNTETSKWTQICNVAKLEAARAKLDHRDLR